MRGISVSVYSHSARVVQLVRSYPLAGNDHDLLFTVQVVVNLLGAVKGFMSWVSRTSAYEYGSHPCINALNTCLARSQLHHFPFASCAP
jgi:hypothetical protein